MNGPNAKQISQLLKSGQFDAEWYLRTYPDVAALGMHPAEHYLLYGQAMNRDPAPGLSTRFLRTAYGIKLDQEPPARLNFSDSKSGRSFETNPKRVLVAANKVALAGDHDNAIQLAEDHLPPDLAYTTNILQGNAALAQADEDGWQRHLNAYLKHFGVAPIRLQGVGALFNRLACDSLPEVTGGPLVSVIMPAWNAEKMVGIAARSVLNQTWRNLELLIIDDCSTDGTWPILQQLAASDRRVKIMRNKVNVGPYVSKNIALMHAQGEWITGHDADDWAHPERLVRQFDFCSKYDLTASMSGMLRVAETGQFVRLNRIGGFVYDGACRSGFISLLVHAKYLRDNLGGWDAVRTSGDSELLRRIEAIEKKSVPQLNSVTMFCLDNPDGLTNHPTLGYNENEPVSPVRLKYKEAFTQWHSGLTKMNSKIDVWSSQRPFEAPAEICAKAADVKAVLNAHTSTNV